jgi:hypothetical protein
MNLIDLLTLIENYIMEVDPDMMSEELMNIFEWVHSNNYSHSCYDVHTGWRAKTQEAAQRYK